MSNVHSILEASPHLSGEAVCLACKHKWVAVAPIGETCLECPSCGTYRGVFTGNPMGETHFECRCGCSHFAILPGLQFRCLHCAYVHTTEELGNE
jgi:hypothetical protein